LPNRDAFLAASPPRLSPRCIVRIDVHGSKDQAKDASHRAESVRSRYVVPTLWCVGRRHSPPRRPPDIRCRRRVTRRGRKPAARPRTDRGLLASCVPRRTPPFSRPECLSPSRHAKESLFDEGIAPSGLRAGSPAHAAHTWSSGEDCAFRTLQGHGAVTRGFRDYSLRNSRVQTPFRPALIPAPGTDDPSTKASSTDSAVSED